MLGELQELILMQSRVGLLKNRHAVLNRMG